MEMAEMYGYAQDFGYEAEADPSVTYAGDVSSYYRSSGVDLCDGH